jgi:hypothetical protein
MIPRQTSTSSMMPALLAELVELGRQAWLISVQEKAVRTQINALHEKEEGHPTGPQVTPDLDSAPDPVKPRAAVSPVI